MSNSLSVEKSKPSRVKRLRFLPRVALFVDFGGRELSYRQAPLLETLYNMRGRKFSLKGLLEVAHQQLSEINLRDQAPIPFAGTKIGGSTAKPKRRKS